ncbi:hypothetical protein D5E79_17530 [Vibrio parahaemolyticus]|nr:hypothetical protein D5E79_17530 [Vibrio parahaemolyticus]
MYITTFCEVKIIRQGSVFLLYDFEPIQFKRFLISALIYFTFKLMAYLLFLARKETVGRLSYQNENQIVWKIRQVLAMNRLTINGLRR